MKTILKYKPQFKTWILMVTIVTLISTNSNTLNAQEKWSTTIRGGVNFPLTKISEAKLKAGFGMDATAAYSFMEHLRVYMGWSFNHFNSDLKFNDKKIEFVETGYSAGLTFIHPIGESKINYVVGAGAIYNHIEMEDESGIVADSGYGFGYQADAGILIPLTDQISILPGVRYKTLSRDLKFGDNTTKADLNYAAGVLGFTWTF